jgi:hypothetical protein
MLKGFLNRRSLLFAAVLGVVAALAIPVAFADSPHWISSSDSINSNTGVLTCSFKEAGLGTVSSTFISCSADASATYYCVNGGGNHPKAANKETVTAPVSNGGNFPVRNGQTTGSVTVSPPGPGSFSCPGGQQLVLGSVSYTNVTLSGEGGSVTLPDRSATFITF